MLFLILFNTKSSFKLFMPLIDAKPRLLIPFTVQFAVRYVLRTGLLDRITEYAQPQVIMGWEDQILQKELMDRGIETFLLPRKRIGPRYERLLKQLTFWHLKKINTPTTAIDRRRNDLLMPSSLRLWLNVRNAIFGLLASFPPYIRFLLSQQEKMVRTDTNLAEYYELVKQIQPDLAFCMTPYFVEEEFLLRAAACLDIPISTSILSFDNLTTRGILPIPFEEYYLWNKYNVAELRRIYPETVDKPVKIVGAPQFDFYYDPACVWAEGDWRKELGIPLGRPVILFGSASGIIAPQEEQWLLQLDEAIEQKRINNNPIILFRRHPNESMDRWNQLKPVIKNVIFDEPWVAGLDKLGKTNVALRDIEKLASTLKYSAVHINASSTMTIDGAIFDRPQIGPAYDETGRYDLIAREIYLREHYLPITRSGGLEIVHSRQALIEAVNNAFQAPQRLVEERKNLVREICTFTDGLCASRVNEAVHSFVEKHRSN